MKHKVFALLLAALLLCGCTEDPAATQASTTPVTTLPTTVPVTEPSDAPTAEPTTQPTTAPTEPQMTGALTVHFIDVGQADAALVTCDGMSMLIDGGNAEDSNVMYTYLKKHNITHLDYVIGTHAHEDHIGGIAGALNFASVDTVYCPVTSYDSRAFENFVKAAAKHDVQLQVPAAGTSFSLGDAVVTILAVNESEETNNTSIVARIVFGEVSFLFTGDAEYAVEQALVDRGAELASTVLKVGHHGSSTSSSYSFLWNVMPQYAVISVGEDNTYGHPEEEVLSRFRDAQTKLLRTDMQGDIVMTTDGQTLNITVSRNPDADTFGTVGENSTDADSFSASYILNTNSHKFHYPDCTAVGKMSESNKQEYYGSREELIAQGYDPCGICHP